MLNMLQILEDTVEHFSKNPRALDDTGSCRYDNNGCRCAVGRLLVGDIPPEFEGEDVERIRKYEPEQEMTTGCTLGDLSTVDVMFLARLQHLHDCEVNWIAKGLSQEGRAAVDRLKENIEKWTANEGRK